jgi:membrane associated rhomboid family serine protease
MAGSRVADDAGEGGAVSWQDRDYSDEWQGDPVATSWLRRRPPDVTFALMILHGAAFLVMLILFQHYGQVMEQLCVLKGAEAHPFAILLHAIGTTGLLSILFVVLALWSLGARLEPRLGALRVVALYILGNLAAGAAYFGAARLSAGLATTPLDSPIGALAAWCLVAWRQLRDEPVQVFGWMTSAGRMYALCALIVAGMALLMSGVGGLAWLAAAAAGCGSALLAEHWPAMRPRVRRRGVRIVRPSVPRPVAPPARSTVLDTDIDDILAKISREGLAALTPAERERLEAARQDKLRRSH